MLFLFYKFSFDISIFCYKNLVYEESTSLKKKKIEIYTCQVGN